MSERSQQQPSLLSGLRFLLTAVFRPSAASERSGRKRPPVARR
jgi:hypothetical protein